MKNNWIAALLALTLTTPTYAREILLQGKNRLALWKDGTITWEMPWGGIHDLHQTTDGRIWVQRHMKEICAIDPATHKVTWSYNAATSNGNQGKPVEVHTFQPLANGNIIIAESGPARMIEITPEGKITRSFPFKIHQPDPHRDTRLARLTPQGTYLVCHEGDGTVREYSEKGSVIWEYEIPLFDQPRRDGHGPEAFGNAVFSALRLPNGNTLIATGNGHSVLEVNPAKEIVWKITQKDLPGITLAWVTTLQLLPNGNYLIGNCHAGPNQPILIEVEPKTKKVVWQLDAFEHFGNDVSNTLVTKP